MGSCKKHTGTGSSSPKRARSSGVVRSSSLPWQALFHYLSKEQHFLTLRALTVLSLWKSCLHFNIFQWPSLLSQTFQMMEFTFCTTVTWTNEIAYFIRNWKPRCEFLVHQLRLSSIIFIWPKNNRNISNKVDHFTMLLNRSMCGFFCVCFVLIFCLFCFAFDWLLVY